MQHDYAHNSGSIMASPHQRGFTLIELLISVTIIAILTALAMVSYSDLTGRARITDGLSLSSNVKHAVSEYHSRTTRLPASNADVDLPAPEQISSQNVRSVGIQATPVTGTIAISFVARGSIAEGDTLLLVPGNDDGNLRWTCRSNTLVAALLPSNCR